MGTQFRLKETRLKYGKKQPEVAAVLGIGVPAYSMMESGQREINGSKLINSDAELRRGKQRTRQT